MTTAANRLASLSTLGTATTLQHLNNVFENGGYVNYDYGGGITAKVQEDNVAVYENVQYVAVTEGEELTIVVEDD